MALIRLNGYSIPAQNLADGNYTIRYWYNFGFIDSAGQPVQSGTSTTGTQIRGTASVAGGFLTADDVQIYTTVDAQSPSPQSINLSCQVFKGNSALPIYPFRQSGCPSSWIIYNPYPNDFWELNSLAILQQAAYPAYQQQWMVTNQEMIDYVNSLTFANASADVKGITFLDVDPDDPIVPIAVGVNSPLLTSSGGFTAANGFYNVTDPAYGFNLDGVTDDTAALQALVDLVPDGSIIFVPSGTGIDMVIDGTVTIAARHNLRFTSFNDLKFSNTPVPVLRRVGNAGGIMLSFQACFGCTVDGLRFTVDGVIDQFIAIDGNPTTSISSQNNVRNCSFQFSNGATPNSNWVAVYISQNANQNNELMTVENISVFGQGRASKYEGGSITGSNFTLPTATLTSGNVGDRIRIGLASGSGRDLMTTIATVTGPTTGTTTDAATANQTSTRCFVGQSYGTGIEIGPSQNALHFRFINLNLLNCEIGIDIREGSGYIDLVSGGTNDCDIRIRRSIAEGWTINNVVTEGTVQTLYMESGDQLSPLTINHWRGANDSQAAEGWMVLSGTVELTASSFRVAPPLGGKYLRDNGNTANLLSYGNFFCQSGEVGSVDYDVIGFRGMRTWSSINDYGSEAYVVHGPIVSRASDGGPFLTHGPASTSGMIIPGFSSVLTSALVSSARAIENASQTDSLILGEALEIGGAFRTQTPLFHKVGTHGGSATYIFCVVSVAADGSRSLRTYPETVDSVANTLSGSNYIALQWMSVSEAITYEIYLQNPANTAQGWQLATGVPNLFPLPSVYNLTANPAPAFAGWNTIVPTWSEGSFIGFRARSAKPLEVTFTDLDTTPTVRAADRFVASNSIATSITTFDNGMEGQEIDVLCTNGNTTFVNGTIKTNTGADVAGGTNRIYKFIRRGSNWYMF